MMLKYKIRDLPLRLVLKDAFLAWCETSTAHAIPNIVRSRNVVVIVIWICCLLASGSYCMVSVVVSTQAYLSNQAFINSQIVLDPVANFPSITFCNLKKQHKKRARDYIYNVLFLNGTLIKQMNPDFPNNFVDDQQLDIRYKMNDDTNLTEKARRELGFKIDEMLLTCSFSWEPCTLDDFTYSFQPRYGNCYTFNKGTTVKKSSLPGANYGLTMEIFTGDPKVHHTYEFNDGLVFEVHNHSSYPTMNQERVLASIGADTDIKINRNFIKRLGPPYSDCLKDVSQNSTFQSKHFQYLVNTLKRAYTQNLCYILCFQTVLNDACGCMLGSLLKYKEAKTCKTINETKCAGSKIAELQKGTSQTCIIDCPLPCDIIEFKVTTSRASYPTTYYRDLLANHSIIKKSGIAYEDIDRAVLRVNVYYESMTYTSTVETPATTPETFFSNIGGTLGLYLGISVLSVIEIVELVVNIIEILWIRLF